VNLTALSYISEQNVNITFLSRRKLCIHLLLGFVLFGLMTSESLLAFQAPVADKPKDPKQVQIEALQLQAEQNFANGLWDQAEGICSQILAVKEKAVAASVIRGRALLGKNDYSGAIAEFDTGLGLPLRDPFELACRADAYSFRSIALYVQGKYLAAIDSAYLGTLEKSDHIGCHMNRAKAYIARGEYDKAINSLNRIIYTDTKNSEAYSLRGHVYASKLNYDQSIADQAKAIELDGKNALAYERRAVAYSAKKDSAKSLKDLEQALSINPNLPEALCDRATVFATMKEWGKAMGDLDAAIRINPKHVQAHYLKSKAFKAQNKSDEALKCLDQAIAAGEDATVYCERGNAYLDKKESEKGLKDFTRAAEINPTMLAAFQGRAKAHKRLGMTDEAAEDIAKVKELTPPKPEEKKKGEKKSEPPIPKFVVKAKPVDAAKLPEILAASKKIDSFILSNYAKFKIKPNAPLNDHQFLRRVYLDATGTIPNLREINKFMISTDPDKRSKLIDELLNSEGYVSHYFNFWADILRYKDSLNNGVRGEPYRQWIKQSLAENKPWNKITYEMMSAQGLIWDNPATGYMQRDPSMPLDIMNNTIRIFLGTRIGCAQCHNHPFDRWTQKEFYQMAAFTFGTHNATYGGDKRYWNADPNDRLRADYSKIEQEEEDRRLNGYVFDRMISQNMMLVNDQVDAKIKLPKDYAYDDDKPETVVEPKTLFGKPAEIKPGEAPRKAFAKWLVSKENPRFAKTIANRLWKQLFGIGQIEPVDDMMDSTVAENPELMVFLESEMKRLNFDMKEYIRMLMNTEVYQRESSGAELSREGAYHFPGPSLRRMTAEQVWDSFLTLTADSIEYREPPATIRTSLIKLDLTKASAMEVVKAEQEANKADYQAAVNKSKFQFKGEFMARASELPSPVPPDHFLRLFGQSDRELISSSSVGGSVPQILMMFNGPMSHKLLEKDSTIYNSIVKKKTIHEGIKTIFLTILTRPPEAEELTLSVGEVKEDGPIGYGNVVWSLLNTREFLFIQ
jgi:tetratricopeptide (TPR) repeat protein